MAVELAADLWGLDNSLKDLSEYSPEGKQNQWWYYVYSGC